MAFYMTVIGILFSFISIDLFNYSEGDWLANLVLAALFIFGLLALFSLPFLIFAKKKILVFTLTAQSLTMSDSSDKADTDFNKSIPLAEIKNFYHKKKIKWGGHGEFINGLFYLDLAKHEKLFLDLTLPEVKIKEESIEKIIHFVKD